MEINRPDTGDKDISTSHIATQVPTLRSTRLSPSTPRKGIPGLERRFGFALLRPPLSSRLEWSRWRVRPVVGIDVESVVGVGCTGLRIGEHEVSLSCPEMT